MVISRQKDSRDFHFLHFSVLSVLFFNNEYVFPPRFYFETFKPTEETGAAREWRLRTATETHQRPVSGASALSCSPQARFSEPSEGTLETPRHLTPKHFGTFLPGKRTFFYGATTPSSLLKSLLLNNITS